MHSSISNSKCPALAYTKVLCGICIVFLIALEGLSAYLLEHHSGTYQRVSQQVPQAFAARPAGPGEPASVLMIGNSLFLDGVQVDRLRALTSDKLRIYPIFLEGTGYYDWLYGLKRIFRLGARPQVVIVQLELNSLLWNRVRTEYSSMLLFDAPDVLRVASDLGLDRTAKNNLLLAHWSAFWNIHGVIRTQILLRAIPHFEELFSLIRTPRNTSFGPGSEAIAESRLKTINQLCDAYGAKVIMLAPPTPSSEEALRKLVTVSERIGVSAIVPLNPTALTAADYAPDAFHLNSVGATLFTSEIARSIGPFLYRTGTANDLNPGGSPRAY